MHQIGAHVQQEGKHASQSLDERLSGKAKNNMTSVRHLYVMAFELKASE